VTQTEYEELADFRYRIRRFLHFSEGAAHTEGLETQQHQALLAIRAMPGTEPCTIGAVARRLFLQHQSTVGLVDRLERAGLVRRAPSPADGRQVLVTLTRKGDSVLKRLSLTHHAELEIQAPELARALGAIIRRLKRNENRQSQPEAEVSGAA
jgi:DNA-binding MarR family transcriptional regulator